MNTAASFIVIFSVWIAGIAIALYLFLPSIATSISTIDTYSGSTKDTNLKMQIGIDSQTSYTSLTPLGIFDFLK